MYRIIRHIATFIYKKIAKDEKPGKNREFDEVSTDN